MRPPATRPLSTGVLVATGVVAATTALIFALRGTVPVLSTGVLYLLGVLLISSYWGLWLGVLTAAASATAFNYFHIPPTGHFTIARSENWVALGVFFVTAIVVSTLADTARTRAAEAQAGRREADLAAALARILLSGEEGALAQGARRIDAAAGTDGVALATEWVDSDERHTALPLLSAGRRIGTLLVPRSAPAESVEQLRSRLVPALGPLLEARQRRAALEEQAVETRALRQSDVLKTALLRAVSHDLRSPLTAISAAAGGIDSETLTHEQRQELKEVIAGESERLSTLVNQLLDLSRLEGGSAEPQREPSALEEVMQAAADTPQLRAAALDVHIDPDLPLVDGDPAQLERAFVNVLQNAARYSNGQPVAVRAHRHGRRVLVRVSDGGPGIGKEDLQHIFEPFYRGEDAWGVGSGLGLAIARGFVEANGGRLRAESLPGQGASFVFDLPVSEPR